MLGVSDVSVGNVEDSYDEQNQADDHRYETVLV
jgi:hypothetical protein